MIKKAPLVPVHIEIIKNIKNPNALALWLYLLTLDPGQPPAPAELAEVTGMTQEAVYESWDFLERIRLIKNNENQVVVSYGKGFTLGDTSLG